MLPTIIENRTLERLIPIFLSRTKQSLIQFNMAEQSPDPKASHPATHHDRTQNHHKETHGRNDDIDENTSKDEVKAPNVFERIKEEIEAMTHHDRSPPHHKETHGRNDDIDETTAVDEVRGPSVFERVKEEVEALAEAFTPKKESK